MFFMELGKKVADTENWGCLGLALQKQSMKTLQPEACMAVQASLARCRERAQRGRGARHAGREARGGMRYVGFV